jgi:hypothetical protein
LEVKIMKKIKKNLMEQKNQNDGENQDGRQA